ncbi:hypothetical protein FGO68_gene3798 [Halteria grandinella]|uniref:Uncharacterized protein n=1 Tax=Halteria grandinella TaxID=5974 RepID=A0A8J8NWE7_HALGN|nr:hypothetical protein FGO68_gene3798 [Halteria grandinella]
MILQPGHTKSAQRLQKLINIKDEKNRLSEKSSSDSGLERSPVFSRSSYIDEIPSSENNSPHPNPKKSIAPANHPLKRKLQVIKFESSGESVEDVIEDVQIMEKMKDKKRAVIISQRLDSLTDGYNKQQNKKENKLKKRRSTLKGKDEDSECELPASQKHVISKITNKEYLKLFQMKNQTHDRDRERAKSINDNIFIPHDPNSYSHNPYLNKKIDEESHLNLYSVDLMSLNQITPDTFQKYRERCEEDIYSDTVALNEQLENAKKRKLEIMMQKANLQFKANRLNKLFRGGIKNVLLANQTKSDSQMKTPQIKLIDNASPLTNEVRNAPLIGLKQKFIQKSKEMHSFVKTNRLHEYDDKTLITELDKMRFYKKDEEVKLLKQYEKIASDKMLVINSRIPKLFIHNLSKKFAVNEKHLKPFHKEDPKIDELQYTEEQGKLFDVAPYISASKKSYNALLRKIQQRQDIYPHIQDESNPLSSFKANSTIYQSQLSLDNSQYAYTLYNEPQEGRRNIHLRHNSDKIQHQPLAQILGDHQRRFSNTRNMGQQIQRDTTFHLKTFQDLRSQLSEAATLVEKHSEMSQRLQSIGKIKPGGGAAEGNEERYEIYSNDYQKKESAWARNEIKKVDYNLQRLNFKALTQKRMNI